MPFIALMIYRNLNIEDRAFQDCLRSTHIDNADVLRNIFLSYSDGEYWYLSGTKILSGSQRIIIAIIGAITD